MCAETEKSLSISTIIPVFNGEHYLDKCLDALMSSDYPRYEIVVVDDASTDRSVEICQQKGVKVVRQSTQCGPAAARNLGAQNVKGDILFFIDADVLVDSTTMSRVAAHFQKNPDIAAVFGSYDDSPAENHFISQYKNLSHHFVHQHSSTNAVSFWAGCGAIGRKVFHKMDGFDSEKFHRPSIEDIELGLRLSRNGYRIVLDKNLQVKHLKKWSFLNLVRTDIFQRAVPWSMLILESGRAVNDLNLKTGDRISAGLVALSAGIFPLVIVHPYILFLLILLLFCVFILNHRLYQFFLNRRGLRFVILAFPLHLFYYLYSGATFAVCWSRYNFLRNNEKS